MNREEFVKDMSLRSGIAKTRCNAAIDAFTTSLIAAMANGEEVMIMGLGTFKVKTRAEKKGWDPYRKEPIVVPEYQYPVFTPSKNMVNAVKEKRAYRMHAGRPMEEIYL